MECLKQLAYICHMDSSHSVKVKAKEALMSFGKYAVCLFVVLPPSNILDAISMATNLNCVKRAHGDIIVLSHWDKILPELYFAPYHYPDTKPIKQFSPYLSNNINRWPSQHLRL